MAPTPGSDTPVEFQPTSSEFTLKLKEILKSNGIGNPVSGVFVKDSGLKGENLASLTEYITVQFEDSGKKPLHLFVKKPTLNQEYNKMLEDWQLFQKETVFFMKYLPKAREFCRSLGQEKLMDIYPKCYYGDDKLVVFENLVLGKGYVLLDKLEQQDFETAKLSLTNLAKHHAISHALIQEHGGASSFFDEFPNLKFEAFSHGKVRELLSPSLNTAVDTVVKILGDCEKVNGIDDGRLKAIEAFMSKKDKQFDEILKSLVIIPGEFLVLNHGDFWNNNAMFLKDKATNQVTSSILIDFQATRYTSPCVDLGYYLFTSVKPNVRRGQFKNLLETYLKALKSTANDLGHPIDLSLEELEADFCKHFHFGYWQALDVTTGAGYAVLKDLELNDDDGVAEWNARFDKLIGKWIDEHPEECAKNVENIIGYYEEYVRFTSMKTTP